MGKSKNLRKMSPLRMISAGGFVAVSLFGFFWRGLSHTQTLFCFRIITACADGAAQMAFSVTPSAAAKSLPNVRTLKQHTYCSRDDAFPHDMSTTTFDSDDDDFPGRRSSGNISLSIPAVSFDNYTCALDHARSSQFTTPRNQQQSAPIAPPQPLYPHSPPVSSIFYIAHTIPPNSGSPVDCPCSIFTALFSARFFRLRSLICSR